MSARGAIEPALPRARSVAALLLGMLLVPLGAGGCAHSRQVVPPPSSALPAVEVESSGVPFAPAPEGLLRPGAVEAIQDRLHARGLIAASARTGRLDAPTRKGLRRFQDEKDLPATGLPSYRTIEALKLDPDRVFFSSRRPPPVDPERKSNDASLGARDTPKAPP